MQTKSKRITVAECRALLVKTQRTLVVSLRTKKKTHRTGAWYDRTRKTLRCVCIGTCCKQTKVYTPEHDCDMWGSDDDGGCQRCATQRCKNCGRECRLPDWICPASVDASAERRRIEEAQEDDDEDEDYDYSSW